MTEQYSESGVPWIGAAPSHWSILEPRRIFRLRREVEKSDDVHLTPSQKHGVLPQEEYMARTGARVVLNLSGTTMQHVAPGDFISHLRTFQGGLELSRIEGKVSPAYTVVAPGPGADPEYYKYVFKSQGYISQIASITDQLRDGQSMRFPEFNKTWLPVPPLAEQRAIADYLDHETAEIDAFIADLEKLKALASERLTDLRLSAFRAAEESSTVALRRVVRIVSGSGFPVGSQGDASQEIPFFKVKDLSGAVDGHLQYPSDSVSRKQAKELGAKILPPGSIVMAKIGAALYLNRNAMVQAPSCIDNNLMALVPDRIVEPAYLQQVLHTLDLRPLGNPGAVPSLNMDWFKELRVHLPDRDVQREVADRFDSQRRNHDKYLEEIDNALALAGERRAALISAAVTGKLDDSRKNQPVAQRLETEIGVTR